MKFFLFYFIFSFTNLCFAHPVHLSNLTSKMRYSIVFEEQEQNYIYRLNDIDYSTNQYRVTQLNMTYKWNIFDAQLFIDVGFGNHYSQVTYQKGSSLYGQKITENNSSIQNPHFEFYIPTSYILYEANDKEHESDQTEKVISDKVKELIYFQFTPGLFDQNATIKNNRMIEGHQFAIGYFRWTDSQNYGFFGDFSLRNGDEILEPKTNSILSKHDQNTLLKFGVTGKPIESLDNFKLIFQIQQQLDKIIKNTNGTTNRSEGFVYYSIGGSYIFEIELNKVILDLKYTQYPSRAFKSGEYLFQISSDAVTDLKLSYDF